MSLSRVDSRSPLHAPPSFSDSKLSSSPFPALLSAFHPRKNRYRTTVVGLAFVVFVSTYIFLIHGTSLSPALSLRRVDSPVANQLDVAQESIQNSRVHPDSGPESPKAFKPFAPIHHNHDAPLLHRPKGIHRQRPALDLDPSQELAAVSSFIASLPQNVIPPTVDPSRPIDPQLVLDFDTRGAKASDEVRNMVEEVWSRNPVFVYSKLYHPMSRELKTMLGNLHLSPAPTIVDVDMRDDADVLKPMLARLTSIEELPILLVGGKALGTIEQLREMAENGELVQAVTAAGAVVNGAKKKKGKK